MAESRRQQDEHELETEHDQTRDEDIVDVAAVGEVSVTGLGGVSLETSRSESNPRTEMPPQPTPSNSHGQRLDSEYLSLLLDDDCNKIKRDVMEFFVRARSQMLEHETAAVERERREWMRAAAAKQEEIDILNDKLAAKDAEAQRLSTSFQRAVDFRARTLERSHSVEVLVKAMAAWSIQHAKGKETRRKLRLWEAHRRNSYQVGTAFKSWRSHVHRNIHNSLRAKYEAGMEQQKVEMIEERTGLVDALRRECEELQEKLEREISGRKALEEQMKKAFMRGVCALNLEAMSLMKSGHAPEGSNPFYGPLEERAEEENVAPPSVHKSQPAMSPGNLGFRGSGLVEGLMARQEETAPRARQSMPQASGQSPGAGPGAPVSSASAALDRFLASLGGQR